MAKGFTVERRTASLDFAEGSPYHGVEATVSISMPFKTLFWFQENAGSEDGAKTQEALATLAAQKERVSWAAQLQKAQQAQQQQKQFI